MRKNQNQKCQPEINITSFDSTNGISKKSKKLLIKSKNITTISQKPSITNSIPYNNQVLNVDESVTKHKKPKSILSKDESESLKIFIEKTRYGK